MLVSRGALQLRQLMEDHLGSLVCCAPVNDGADAQQQNYEATSPATAMQGRMSRRHYQNHPRCHAPASKALAAFGLWRVAWHWRPVIAQRSSAVTKMLSILYNCHVDQGTQELRSNSTSCQATHLSLGTSFRA